MEARLQGERMGSVKKKKISVDSLDRISLRKKDGSGFGVRLD